MKSNSLLSEMGLLILLVIWFGSVSIITSAQDEATFPLAETGPYGVGRIFTEYIDITREDRRVSLSVLYPILKSSDSEVTILQKDATPDRSGAPYPLILTGYNTGDVFSRYLPSHGYVMAIIIDSSPVYQYAHELIDYPRDIIFALDQLASVPPELLAGVIDTDHVGVMGYSWDGYGALSVSGARADPTYYIDTCSRPLENLGYPQWWNDYACSLVEDWETFVANAGPTITYSKDGLWQPITDERIRAVAPMGPEGALFFGPRGLAAVDRPTLIIAGTEDDMNVYGPEEAYIFEHLGTPDGIMISFVGQGHMMVLSQEPFLRMRHFVTAFFGFYLKDEEVYAEYFSREFVEQFDDLAWGVFSPE